MMILLCTCELQRCAKSALIATIYLSFRPTLLDAANAALMTDAVALGPAALLLPPPS